MERFEVEIAVSVHVYPTNPIDSSMAAEARKAIYDSLREDLKQVEEFYSDMINSKPLRIPSFLSEERKKFLIERLTGKPYPGPDKSEVGDEVPGVRPLNGVGEPN